MNDLKGKKSIIYLPDGFISYVGSDGAVSFEKFSAEFNMIKDMEVFSVCIDDMFWINKKYQLTDIEKDKAYFAKKDYSSIHARVAAVYSALCEGKIKIDPDIDKTED